MPFVTKDTFTFNHTTQPDYPAWTPALTKANLDARDEELRLALNVVVNALNATTAAGLVGAVAPTGLVGSNVQTILSALKTAIDGVALGAIPDGSLTDAKFSPANLKTTPYVPTTNVGNAYSVTVTGMTLVDGLPLCVKFNAASTNAITVNLNGLGAKSVVDYFGNAVTNVRLNLIANLRYDAVNGNFQLQGKGGGGNALVSDLRLSKTATTDAGPITGSLDLSAVVSGNLRAGVTIDGITGKPSVVDTSDANAIASQILAGLYAYVNGSKLTGTMADLSTASIAATAYSTEGIVRRGTQNIYDFWFVSNQTGKIATTTKFNTGITGLAPEVILTGNTIGAGATGAIVGTAIGMPYTVGDAITISDITTYTTTSTTYAKVGKRYTAPINGSIRIKTVLGVLPGTNVCFQTIYKNGVAVGVERMLSAGSADTTYSEDFTCVAGDYFDIYLKTYSSYTVSLKGFSIGTLVPTIGTMT